MFESTPAFGKCDGSACPVARDELNVSRYVVVWLWLVVVVVVVASSEGAPSAVAHDVMPNHTR